MITCTNYVSKHRYHVAILCKFVGSKRSFHSVLGQSIGASPGRQQIRNLKLFTCESDCRHLNKPKVAAMSRMSTTRHDNGGGRLKFRSSKESIASNSSKYRGLFSKEIKEFDNCRLARNSGQKDSDIATGDEHSTDGRESAADFRSANDENLAEASSGGDHGCGISSILSSNDATTLSFAYNQKRNCSSSTTSSQQQQQQQPELDCRISRGRFRPTDYYDETLTGLNPEVDKEVEKHKLETMTYNQDRELKDQQARLVFPGTKQSPIALMTVNPAYRCLDKPLILEYQGSVENLRLNNTGYFWDLKIPYQISMTTALYGAQFSSTIRYRLDQLHCHWGSDDNKGSEHTVDSRYYSAEMHLVHYNMDKYRTLAQAARHPDGLVVLAVFLEARDTNLNHPEIEKIATNLKDVSLRGDHTIIRQGIRIDNLLPQNRSFWSYHGSLTTSPYYESVTWFVLKHPIQCSSSQLQKFRSMKSSSRQDEESNIMHNFREVQPLHGRTVINFDDAHYR